MKFFTTAILLLSFSCTLFAALPNGTIAPDWTLTDIDGDTYNLHDILDDGKSVILDFSATWCSPCWSYHNTGILEQMYDEYGPDGTDEIRIFFIEVDGGTNEACLSGPAGCNDSSWGDWTDVPYPIFNLVGSDLNVGSQYAITAIPTLYGIGHQDKKTFNIGQVGVSTWESWMVGSFKLDAEVEISNDASCGGGSAGVGSIDLTPLFGFGSFSYSWSNGSNAQDPQNLTAASYFVTITDGHGYSVERGPFVVGNDEGSLDIGLDISVDPQCHDGNDGVLKIEAYNGSDVYIYEWFDGFSGPDRYNLSAGTYQVEVSDIISGCSSIETFVIENPELITFSEIVTQPSCDGNDGSIVLEAIGGVGDFEYDFGEGFDDENTFSNASSGMYEIGIRDDGGCVINTTITLLDKDTVHASIQSIGFLSCDNETMLVHNDTSAINENAILLWQNLNGDTLNFMEDSILVESVSSIVLTIQDSFSLCSDKDTVDIAFNYDAPSIEINTPEVLTCTTESIQIEGSTEDLLNVESYVWSTANGLILSGNTELNPIVGASGEYLLTAKNMVSGCETNTSVAVLADENIPEFEVGSPEIITCANQATELSVTADENYSYTWSDEQGAIISNDDAFLVNEPGMYFVEAVSAINGCATSKSVSVEENIQLPSYGVEGAIAICSGNETTLCVQDDGMSIIEWNVNGISQQARCITITEESDVQLKVIGQNGCSSEESIYVEVDNSLELLTPILDQQICEGEQATFCLNESFEGTIKWIDENGQIIGEEACITADVQGRYTIECETTLGCTKSFDAALSVSTTSQFELDGPTGICEGLIGSVCLTESFEGEIEWRLEGDNNVLSTDQCLQITEGGTYIASVVNAEGCEVVLEKTIAFYATPQISTMTYSIDCQNPLAILDVNELLGQDVAEISWSTTNGNFWDLAQNFSPTVDAIGTYKGEYTTTNGCNGSFEIEVDGFFNYASSAFSYDNQYGDVAFTEASTGEVTSWAWSFGDGNTSMEENPKHNYQNSGTYNVCLVVTNECGEAQFCEELDIVIPLPLSVNPTWENISCFGANDASIQLEIEGGVPEYTVSWTGPNGFTSTDFNLDNLEPGEYEFTIFDILENELMGTLEMYEPTLLEISGASIVDDSLNMSIGTIDISFEGGTEPYFFEWSNGETTEDISDLMNGDYSVEITDANGCQTSMDFEIQNLISGLDDLGLISFNIYPNPVQDEISIELDFVESNTEFTLSIMDLSGKLIKVERKIGKSKTQMDISNLNSGLYLLQLNTALGQTTIKICKE